MSDLKDKIASTLKIIINKKRCSLCFKPFSKQTVSLNVFESLKSKSSVFAASDYSPMHSRQASMNRTVCCRTTLSELEPALCICITCHCGNEMCLNVPNK